MISFMSPEKGRILGVKVVPVLAKLGFSRGRDLEA